MKNNIVSIDAVISRIEINGYIDCTKLGGYMEDYEYDNIIYYLKKYKNLQNRIDKAYEQLRLLHYNFPDYDEIHHRIQDIEDILKESGE